MALRIDTASANRGLREQLTALLQDQTASLLPDRVALEAANLREGASVGGAARRGSRALGRQAAAELAQQLPARPADYGSALGDAMRRVRARSKVMAAGDKALEQQQLRDRLALAARGRQREGALTTSLGTARNIIEGVNVGINQADTVARRGAFDMAGTLTGALTRGLADTSFGQGVQNKVGGFFKGIFGGK